MPAPLVALTPYYNPFRGERRRRNYRTFRKHIGVPLVTVEWARDGQFDLSPGDADVVIRVEGGDLMWQKERLINIGLAHIRREGLARDVAVVDSDVVFIEPDWAQRVSAALDSHLWVHCQSQIDYLDLLPMEMPERDDLARATPERTIPSLGYAMANGEPLFTSEPARARDMAVSGLPNPGSGNAGLAGAFRLEAMPDFEYYDGNIVGGADLLMASAWVDQLDDLFNPRGYAYPHRDDVAAWVARCLPPAPRPPLGWADNRAVHLWHGSLEDRGYGERLRILGPRNYDPARDIDRSGQALRFAQGVEDLQEAVAAYLASRDDA